MVDLLINPTTQTGCNLAFESDLARVDYVLRLPGQVTRLIAQIPVKDDSRAISLTHREHIRFAWTTKLNHATRADPSACEVNGLL